MSRFVHHQLYSSVLVSILIKFAEFQFALSNDLQRADEYFKTSERQINLSRKHWSFQLWCRLEKTLANGFLVNVTATWEKLNPRLMIEPSEHFSVVRKY